MPSHFWPVTEESDIPYTELPNTLAKWQNPREADSLTKVQEEVEETKIILVGRTTVLLVYIASASNFLIIIKGACLEFMLSKNHIERLIQVSESNVT